MRELTMEEVGQVSGAMRPETGLGLIAALGGVAAFIGAPAAAAFAAGVVLGDALVQAFSD